MVAEGPTKLGLELRAASIFRGRTIRGRLADASGAGPCGQNAIAEALHA
jgi:hypothetical protein